MTGVASLHDRSDSPLQALHYRSCGLVSLTSRRTWRSLPNGSMMVLWSGLTHGSSDTPLSGVVLFTTCRLARLTVISAAQQAVMS